MGSLACVNAETMRGAAPTTTLLGRHLRRRCHRRSTRSATPSSSTPSSGGGAPRPIVASFNPFPFMPPPPPDLSGDLLSAAATFALQTNLRSSSTIEAGVDCTVPGVDHLHLTTICVLEFRAHVVSKQVLLAHPSPSLSNQ